MVVEASKFLLFDTSENYKQVEILLKLVNELLLENINVYFITIINNKHEFCSEVYIVELDFFEFYCKLQFHFRSETLLNYSFCFTAQRMDKI